MYQCVPSWFHCLPYIHQTTLILNKVAYESYVDADNRLLDYLFKITPAAVGSVTWYTYYSIHVIGEKIISS